MGFGPIAPRGPYDASDPECPWCHGTGSYLVHAHDCADDNCALTNRASSCEAVEVDCDCWRRLNTA